MELNFRECKTMMDLRHHERDVAKCDGKITCKELNTINETGIVTFEIDNVEEFEEKFKKTNAYKSLDQEL